MPTITSPINEALPLRGVTKAARPSLNGRVVLDGQANVVLPTEIPTPAELAVRVVRSNATGLMDFYYRLSLPVFECDQAIRLSVSFQMPGFVINFADFRLDLPGILPPNYFESTASEQAIFRFDYGVSPEREARFCFISTNAREIRDHGASLNIILHDKTRVRLDVPAPIALASVFRPAPLLQHAEPAEGDTSGETRSLLVPEETDGAV